MAAEYAGDYISICRRSHHGLPSALESIGRPEFYHFLYNSTKQMFAIQACGMDAEGANRVPKKNQDDRYEIKSKNLRAAALSELWLGQNKILPAAGVLRHPQQRPP